MLIKCRAVGMGEVMYHGQASSGVYSVSYPMDNGCYAAGA
jgi:hypothetical protein